MELQIRRRPLPAGVKNKGVLADAQKYTRKSLVEQVGAAICRRVLDGTIDSAQAQSENDMFAAAVDVLVRLRDMPRAGRAQT